MIIRKLIVILEKFQKVYNKSHLLIEFQWLAIWDTNQYLDLLEDKVYIYYNSVYAPEQPG